MPRGHKEGRSGDRARSVYELKITLIDSQPPIWRRVQVESGVTLDHLHHTLQIVMGWTDSQPHARVPCSSTRPARGAAAIASG